MNVRVDRWVQTISCFLTGALVVTGALVLMSAQSTADESEQVAASKKPKCIRNGDYGSILGEEARGKRGNTKISGTRARIWIPPKGPHCQRIASIYGGSKAGHSAMEFGVVVGFSNCTSRRYKKPHIFVWIIRHGHSSCSVGRAITPRQYDTFTVSDKDKNGYWGPYFNGHELYPDGVKMGFARGTSYFGMERGSRKDSGVARYHTLREHHGGWSKWDHLKKGYDKDPGYRLKKLSHSAANIVHK